MECGEEKKYIAKWKKELGIGIQTTCVYQYLSDELENIEIIQYFVYEGLKVVVRIPNYATHVFYPHAFSHCTAFLLAINNSGKVISKFGSGINVFAWGVGQKDKKH